MKISIWNLAHVITWWTSPSHHHATFGSNRSSGGFPRNRGNITLLWLFCYTVFFLGYGPRSNRRTDFYVEWLKWRVFAQGRSFWGSGRWVTSCGENMSPKLPKRDVNRQFQLPKRQNVYTSQYLRNYFIRRTSDVRAKFRPRNARRHSAITPKANTTWLTAAILKIDMTSYFRSGSPIWMKFGSLM